MTSNDVYRPERFLRALFLITSMLWGSWKNSAYQRKHYYKRKSRIYFWTRSMWQPSFLLSIVFWSDTLQSINSCSDTDQLSLYFYRVLNSLKIYFSGRKCCWGFLGWFFFFPITEVMMLSRTLADTGYFSSFSAFKGTAFSLFGSMFGCPLQITF